MVVMHEWLPSVGYQSWRELTEDVQRQRHGLEARLPQPSLQDEGVRYDTAGQERSPVAVIVSTTSDQVALAPGTLRREWTTDGRRYFEYATNAPIGPGYAVFSARYARRTARAGDVDLEVWHDPTHTLNVDRMLRAMQASLRQYQQRFGPYPHDVLRMIEHPAAGGGLHSATANIWYDELFSLLDASADTRDIDVPFAVVAHEVAHQFQPPLARAEGRALLSEAFAWYAALGVVEEAFGADHLHRVLDLLRSAFQAPRARAGVPLIRATDDFDAYRRGPLALYALQQYIGRDSLDLAWKRLLAAHRSATPPLPTSLDLLRELRAVTPTDLLPLVRDLFERNTFWQLRTERVSFEAAGSGLWRVTVDVQARKFVVDERGRETDATMDDPVEIRVYSGTTEAAQTTLIHRAFHRMRTGTQRIVIDVAQKPTMVVVDPQLLLTAPRYE
jgi:aminopeptidase N